MMFWLVTGAIVPAALVAAVPRRPVCAAVRQAGDWSTSRGIARSTHEPRP